MDSWLLALFPRGLEVGQLREFFVMEELFNSFACAGIGQRKGEDASASLQQQDVKRAPFKLPLDYSPT